MQEFLRNQIAIVARGLHTLEETFVFVGGAVVECYKTSPAAEQARQTDDIDITVELTHYGEYALLQEKLIPLGFNPVIDSKVICRYKYKGITVDIMPDTSAIFGFSNSWYKTGIQTAIDYQVQEDLFIKIFTTPLFLCAKIEAYMQRGSDDKRISQDFEDIVYIIENRRELIDEIDQCDQKVKSYIIQFASQLLSESDTDEAISASVGYIHLPGRVEAIRNSIEKISNL